jgi:hemerythrin superfamily protein
MVSRDVIEEVLEDHEEIKALFARVESASGGQRLDAFNDLVRKLATHETAEQEIVHPLALQADGKGVRDERVSEEKEAEIVLDELLKMGPDDRMFTSKFEALKRDVLAHAEREEAEEHPKIRATIAADRLRALAPAFRAAEATAPTRPHPRGPVSATGNMIVGPIVSIMDRARDAVRNAMSSIGDRAKSSGGAVSTSPSRRRATSTRSRSGSARAKGPVIHVTTDPRGGWRAEKQGGSRALARSDSKREVVKRARDAAKSQEGRLVVHGQDGRIQEERSYGADPVRSRG